MVGTSSPVIAVVLCRRVVCVFVFVLLCVCRVCLCVLCLVCLFAVLLFGGLCGCVSGVVLWVVVCSRCFVVGCLLLPVLLRSGENSLTKPDRGRANRHY